MSKSTIRLAKTAVGLTVMMLASLLLPLLSFAAGLENLSYQNATVTGTVYGKAGEGFGTSPVTVSVYAPDGSLITTTEATYDSVTGDTYTYDFSKYIGSSYDYVRVVPNVTGSVYQDVYRTSSGSGGSGGGSGGGGGGGYIPPGTNGSTLHVSGDTVDAYQLTQALSSYSNVTLQIDGDSVRIPASPLAQAKAGEKVTVKNDLGSYEIPLSVLKLADYAQTLHTDVSNLWIKVRIASANATQSDEVATAAAAQGVQVLSGTVADFGLQAQAASGDSLDISSFGNTYVKRTIAVNGQVDPAASTVAMLDPANGELAFVPSVFDNAVSGSDSTAIFWRTGNSLYAVVKSDKHFNDVPADYWAANDIELLANKLIVAGETPTTFAPKRSVTRAEFAGLLVRALGLSGDKASASFSDVPANAWYANEVGLAAKAGLVYGYGDGTFQPNQSITREEVAAMVIRALKYAGYPISVSPGDMLQLYKPYQDVGAVSPWAHAEMAKALKSGIVVGTTTRTLSPQSQATRAEATAMIRRFLTKAGFIP